MPVKKNQNKAKPRNALKPRRNVARGRGGYYVAGGLYGKAKVPGLGSLGGHLMGGYSSGSTNIPKMSGLGAYNISAIRHNVLIRPELPEIKNAIYAEGGTIIRHREYLGPITTSDIAGKFKISSYPLNPAQVQTFPWLSSIAANYEEYKPNGLMFEFRSTASDAIASSTNLALGQVMLCTQYDPTDPEFNNDVELLNYTWAHSGKISDNVQHFVECDPKQSPLAQLYTRSGGYTDKSDLRFSDFGRFSIATSGLQGASVQVGQLWVTYEFIMYKPKVSAGEPTAGAWFHLTNNTGVSSTDPFGNDPMSNGKRDSENNLDIQLINSATAGEALIRIPPQFRPATFMVNIHYTGGSGSASSPNFNGQSDTAFQFIELLNNYQAFQSVLPTPTGTGTQAHSITWFSLPGDGQLHDLKCTLANFGLTTPVVDVYITQIPYIDPAEY